MPIKKELNMEDRILEIAEGLFLSKGFAMTSTVDIAKAVGCNQALVHYYFRTKERLFEAIFKKKARLFLLAFLNISEEKIPFEEKLSRMISAHFDILRANPKLPFLIINELTTNPTRVTHIKHKLQQLPVNIFALLEKEMQTAIRLKKIRKMSLIDLLIMVISLNVTLFVAKPILMEVTGMSEKAYEKFIEQRKKENIRIIINSLKP